MTCRESYISQTAFSWQFPLRVPHILLHYGAQVPLAHKDPWARGSFFSVSLWLCLVQP